MPPPNTRLKLPPPVIYGRIAFVNRTVWHRRIEEEEALRPSFPIAVRTVARDELGAPEGAARNAISALAIVGTIDDVPALRGAALRDPTLAEDIRLTVREIEDRAAQNQEPGFAGRVLRLRDRAERIVWGFIGVVAIVLGILGALFDDRTADRLTAILAGLGFGFIFLHVARLRYEPRAQRGP